MARSLFGITYEFENLPVEAVKFLETLKPVAPASRILAIAQDRLKEKIFLASNNIAVAKYFKVESKEDLDNAIKEINYPIVLKTTRMGYDGKGQRIINNAQQAEAAFLELKGSVLIAEQFIPFEREISVIVARNKRGQVRDYDASENRHENHILKTSTVPANIDNLTQKRASRIAHEIIAAASDYATLMSVVYRGSLPSC